MHTQTKQVADLERTIQQLEAKRDEYVTRLDDGIEKIEQAQAEGKSTEAWEGHWVNLLRQYEAVCDKLKELTR